MPRICPVFNSIGGHYIFGFGQALFSGKKPGEKCVEVVQAKQVVRVCCLGKGVVLAPGRIVVV